MASFSRRALALGAAGVLALAAPCGLAQAQDLSHGQMDRLGGICSSILRLEPGEAHYVGCVDSLAQAVRHMDQGRAVEEGREACLAHGAKLGSADLAVCTLQAANPDIGPARSTAVSIPGGSKSYSYASNSDRFSREQLACAEIGLQPTSAAFDTCVVRLRATLFAVDNPSQ
jgi:hypothetical protein